VREVTRRMGLHIEPHILGEISNEIRIQHLSARKARTMLGWTPKFTLEQGLDLTIDWYRRFLSHARQI
jgi:CDP-glucose 4,6-dehydratase